MCIRELQRLGIVRDHLYTPFIVPCFLQFFVRQQSRGVGQGVVNEREIGFGTISLSTSSSSGR